MADSKGTADEAIGRPKEWQEDRYQQPGKPVDTTVTKPPDTEESPAPQGDEKPVTLRDYQQPKP